MKLQVGQKVCLTKAKTSYFIESGWDRAVRNGWVGKIRQIEPFIIFIDFSTWAGFCVYTPDFTCICPIFDISDIKKLLINAK